MKKTIELSTKHKLLQTTKDSRPTSGLMVIIREEDTMVEVSIIVEEAITIKVGTKIILEEDLGQYQNNSRRSAQNVHTKIGLT